MPWVLNQTCSCFLTSRHFHFIVSFRLWEAYKYIYIFICIIQMLIQLCLLHRNWKQSFAVTFSARLVLLTLPTTTVLTLVRTPLVLFTGMHVVLSCCVDHRCWSAEGFQRGAPSLSLQFRCDDTHSLFLLHQMGLQDLFHHKCTTCKVTRVLWPLPHRTRHAFDSDDVCGGWTGIQLSQGWFCRELHSNTE